MAISEEDRRGIVDNITNRLREDGLYVDSMQARVRYFRDTFSVPVSVSPFQTSGTHSALDLIIEDFVHGITDYYSLSAIGVSGIGITVVDPVSAIGMQIGLKYNISNLRIDENGQLNTIQDINPGSIPYFPTIGVSDLTNGQIVIVSAGRLTTSAISFGGSTTVIIASGTNSVSGSAAGTIGRIAKFITSASVGDSIMNESGSTVFVIGNMSVDDNLMTETLNVSALAYFNSDILLKNEGRIRFLDNAGSQRTALTMNSVNNLELNNSAGYIVLVAATSALGDLFVRNSLSVSGNTYLAGQLHSHNLVFISAASNDYALYVNNGLGNGGIYAKSGNNITNNGTEKVLAVVDSVDTPLFNVHSGGLVEILKGPFVTSGLNVSGNAYIDGERIYLGGATNHAVFNSRAGMYFNIDWDNNATGEVFGWGHNGDSTGSTRLMTLWDHGLLEARGALNVSGSTLFHALRGTGTRYLGVDASGQLTVAGNVSADIQGTTGRIPYFNTSLSLRDSIMRQRATSHVEIEGQLSATSNVWVGAGTGAHQVSINGGANQYRGIELRTSGTLRWYLYINNDSETSANAGASFRISSYTDSGVYIDDPLRIVRAASGLFNIRRPVQISSNSLTMDNAQNIVWVNSAGVSRNVMVLQSNDTLDIGGTIDGGIRFLTGIGNVRGTMTSAGALIWAGALNISGTTTLHPFIGTGTRYLGVNTDGQLTIVGNVSADINGTANRIPRFNTVASLNDSIMRQHSTTHIVVEGELSATSHLRTGGSVFVNDSNGLISNVGGTNRTLIGRSGNLLYIGEDAAWTGMRNRIVSGTFEFQIGGLVSIPLTVLDRGLVTYGVSATSVYVNNAGGLYNYFGATPTAMIIRNGSQLEIGATSNWDTIRHTAATRHNFFVGSSLIFSIGSTGISATQFFSTGDWIYTQTDHNIRANTSNGSDNKSLWIQGGGSWENTRGPGIVLFGNEYGSSASERGNAVYYSGERGSHVFNTGTAAFFGTRRFTITSAGNIGMGNITTIDDALVVARSEALEVNLWKAQNTADQLFLKMRRARGSISSPSNLQNGDGIGTLLAQPYSGGYFDAAKITFFVNGTVTNGQRPPSAMAFYTNPSNTVASERMRINEDGRVIIGDTAAASNTILAVRYDSGVSNGEHWISEFYRNDAGTDAQVLIGYRANGSSVTGNLIRSGNSQPLYFGTSNENTAVKLTNAGYLIMEGSNPRISNKESYVDAFYNADFSGLRYFQAGNGGALHVRFTPISGEANYLRRHLLISPEHTNTTYGQLEVRETAGSVIAAFGGHSGSYTGGNNEWPAYIYFSYVNTINFGYNVPNYADGWINYVGYNNSTSYNRSLIVGDGKTNEIANFQAETGFLGAYGRLNIGRHRNGIGLLDVRTADGNAGAVIAAFGGNTDLNTDYPGFIYFSSISTINFGYSRDADTGGWINYEGYQGSTSRNRHLYIGDGKRNMIAKFSGEYGTLSIGGDNVDDYFATDAALQLGGDNATLMFGTRNFNSDGDTGPFYIRVRGSGSSTPSSNGTGNGRNLSIMAGDSDNTNGKTGGHLYIRGGGGYSTDWNGINDGHTFIGRDGDGKIMIGTISATPDTALTVQRYSANNVVKIIGNNGATSASLLVLEHHHTPLETDIENDPGTAVDIEYKLRGYRNSDSSIVERSAGRIRVGKETSFNSTTGAASYMAFFTLQLGGSTSNPAIATEKVRINSYGEVGIGTSDPKHVLDVYGSFGSSYIQTTSSNLTAAENMIIKFTGGGTKSLHLEFAWVYPGRVYFVSWSDVFWNGGTLNLTSNSTITHNSALYGAGLNLVSLNTQTAIIYSDGEYWNVIT